MDSFIILLVLLGLACTVLAFLTGYMLGIDAARPRKQHSPEFLPMRMDD